MRKILDWITTHALVAGLIVFGILLLIALADRALGGATGGLIGGGFADSFFGGTNKILNWIAFGFVAWLALGWNAGRRGLLRIGNALGGIIHLRALKNFFNRSSGSSGSDYDDWNDYQS